MTAEQACHLALLARLYIQRRQHTQAAHILRKLAERKQALGGPRVALEERLGKGGG